MLKNRSKPGYNKIKKEITGIIEKNTFSIPNHLKKSQIKILIVEDNPDNMTTLKAILGNDYNIYEAVDGLNGLKILEKERPDIILLDMSLPEMNGEQFLKLLKGKKDTKNIPVIAVTAQAMKGDKERLLKLGFEGYISKPVDIDLLIEEINRLLK